MVCLLFLEGSGEQFCLHGLKETLRVSSSEEEVTFSGLGLPVGWGKRGGGGGGEEEEEEGRGSERGKERDGGRR